MIVLFVDNLFFYSGGQLVSCKASLAALRLYGFLWYCNDDVLSENKYDDDDLNVSDNIRPNALLSTNYNFNIFIVPPCMRLHVYTALLVRLSAHPIHSGMLSKRLNNFGEIYSPK